MIILSKYKKCLFSRIENMKTHLPNVTLINMDCVSLEKTKRAADICELDFSFGAVKILSSISDSDSRIIPIPAIKSREELSNFYITELWKYVDTEFALCFHPDGFILNPSAWTDDFLDYDYIGAPWYHLGEIIVGNGGFAIRSKRLLEYIGKNYKKIGGEFHPEDLWLSEQARPHLEKEGMTFAPEKIAARFSKEGNNRGVVWNGEFGWHGLNYTDISKWFDIHPEYRKFFPQKFDEFTEFMRKYPVYDGTVHVAEYMWILKILIIYSLDTKSYIDFLG